jgi:hypothetical protein
VRFNILSTVFQLNFITRMPEANDLIKGGEKPWKLLIAARLYCVYVKGNDVITFEGRDASVLRPSAGVACMQFQQHLRLLNSKVGRGCLTVVTGAHGVTADGMFNARLALDSCGASGIQH